MLAVDIVKRGGQRPTEAFERAKLERSIRATLLSLRTPDGQAEDTARRVTDIVEQWVADHSEVTSVDIRLRAASALEPLHPDAAYLYKHHKVIM
jgi:transcriptional regulator NrdR family protein